MLFFWLFGLAQAAPHGLVVHLTLSEASSVPVIVHLDGTEEQKVVTMKDDGTTPDVTASDNNYSGTTQVQEDTVTVSVELGDRKIQGGPVSWDPKQTVCDLNLKLDGDNLTAEATTPTPSAPPTLPNTTPVAPADQTAPSMPPTSTPDGAPPTAVVPTSDSSGATTNIVVGVGFLLLAGLLYFGWSGGRSTMVSLPEPGLLGPQTPSLSQGFSRWDAEDSALLAKILLATLARHHRVFLVAPPDFQPDPVFGGPVYRAPNRPGSWKKSLNSLLEEGGLPLAVLWVGPTDNFKTLQRALPLGIGGIFVGGTAEAVPVIRAQRDGNRWHLQTETGPMLVRVGIEGFVGEETA